MVRRSSRIRRAAPGFAAIYPHVSRSLNRLGKRRISRALGVPIFRLDRALTDEEPLPADAAARAQDFEVVLARAYEVFRPAVILDWLEGSERTLGFGRPLDAFPLIGKTPLLDILDRIAAGAYA